MSGAVINHPLNLPGMVGWAFWCTPDTGNTKFTAAAAIIVIGAIHSPPGMAAAYFNNPAVLLGILQSIFNVFLGCFFLGMQ
ncbi:hypothetical protein [Arsukibacterium perlucidum]|uniref:hypothetical protein n=1 Tax=Arsukibacterium perlucidum TaxID=368811 RepID=UPI0012FC2EF7|nr:hypothetical protein [Arsukibacterium perlucidum]